MKRPSLIIFLTLLFSLASLLGCSHLAGLGKRKMQSQKKRYLPLGNPRAVKNIEKMKWHLQITKTQKAWQLSQGDKNIVVAIIDSGVDILHPDLKENIWLNQAEAQGRKGVDDDGNGFVDDLHGWNFADNNNDVMDVHGHGTHVAGIIGGRGQICKPGVAPKVSLMVLKYFDSSADGNTHLQNTIKSIRYAIQNGAHIINFSGGGPEPNLEEKEAIERALEKDILFVAAGGNQHSDLEKKPYYPASYRLPNLLAVGASNTKDEHSSFSNRGKTIMAHAPGTKIYSTLPQARCGFLTGTSQSTPIFTGGAVLIKTHKKLKKPAQIIDYLLKTTDFSQALAGKSQTGGRANFYRALGSEKINVAFNGAKVEYADDFVSKHGSEAKDKAGDQSLSELSNIELKSPPQPLREAASWEDFPEMAIAPSQWTQIFSQSNQF